MTKPDKAPSTKQLLTEFWGMTRPRQEAFLKEIFSLTPENKHLSYVFLAKRSDIVVKKLIEDLQKITDRNLNRTYQKLKIKKINDILRLGQKSCLDIHEQMQLLQVAWSGMLRFIQNDHYCPERYEISAVKLLDKHIELIRAHILETAEQQTQLQQLKTELHDILVSSRRYLFYAKQSYLEHFSD